MEGFQNNLNKKLNFFQTNDLVKEILSERSSHMKSRWSSFLVVYINKGIIDANMLLHCAIRNCNDIGDLYMIALSLNSGADPNSYHTIILKETRESLHIIPILVINYVEKGLIDLTLFKLIMILLLENGSDYNYDAINSKTHTPKTGPIHYKDPINVEKAGDYLLHYKFPIVDSSKELSDIRANSPELFTLFGILLDEKDMVDGEYFQFDSEFERLDFNILLQTQSYSVIENLRIFGNNASFNRLKEVSISGENYLIRAAIESYNFYILELLLKELIVPTYFNLNRICILYHEEKNDVGKLLLQKIVEKLLEYGYEFDGYQRDYFDFDLNIKNVKSKPDFLEKPKNCENKFSKKDKLTNKLRDKSEDVLVKKYRENDKTWCFTPDMYHKILQTGKNPFTGKRLHKTFLRELERESFILEEIGYIHVKGLSPRKEDSSVEIYNNFMKTLKLFGKSDSVFLKLSTDQKSKLLMAIHIYQDYFPFLKREHQNITFARAVLYKLRSTTALHNFISQL